MIGKTNMKIRYSSICFAVFAAMALAISVSAQAKKLKIYISADMEGVVGVVTGDQLGPTGFEYQRFREFMTQEVNAAIDAAFAGGATEIVVADSHGNGENLLIEKLPKNITLVRSWPRPLGMMQGIDETFRGGDLYRISRKHDQPRGCACPHLVERQSCRCQVKRRFGSPRAESMQWSQGTSTCRSLWSPAMTPR